MTTELIKLTSADVVTATIISVEPHAESVTVLFGGQRWQVGWRVFDLELGTADALELLDFDFQPPLDPVKSTKQ